jgi:hypothetical protein
MFHSLSFCFVNLQEKELKLKMEALMQFDENIFTEKEIDELLANLEFAFIRTFSIYKIFRRDSEFFFKTFRKVG